MKKISLSFLTFAFLVIPLFTFAQSPAQNTQQTASGENRSIGILDRLACINPANRGVYILRAPESEVLNWGYKNLKESPVVRKVNGVWTCQNSDICAETVTPPGDFLPKRVWIPLAGSCTVCDALYLLLVGIEWIFGVIGFAIMLVMGWSAFQMVSSAGDSSKYSAGKQGVIGAAIGVAVMLGSYQIVNLVMYAVLVGGTQLGGVAPSITVQGPTSPISTKWYIFCDNKLQIQDAGTLLNQKP